MAPYLRLGQWFREAPNRSGAGIFRRFRERVSTRLGGAPQAGGPAEGGGGRHGALSSSEDKLLFVLVYLKTHPLQVVLGKLFGIRTSQANY